MFLQIAQAKELIESSKQIAAAENSFVLVDGKNGYCLTDIKYAY